MKFLQQVDTIVLGLILTALPGTDCQTYGPNGCVSISRSQQGTCVIATNCGEGVDINKLEFAFDCQNAGAVQKHSFGVGGFDLVEDFDTGIKCKQCKAPENHKVHKSHKEKPLRAAVHSPVHMFAKKKATKEGDLVDKYGPGNCVEAWRGTTGTCILRTQCKGQDISNYNFGMLCVHNVTSGENVRHLFGENSFDPEEEFDTLVKCERCLGLRQEANETATTAAAVAGAKPEDLVKSVNTLVDEVGAMATGLEKIKSDVKVLNEKVPKLFTEGGGKDETKAKESESEAKEGESEGDEKKSESFLSHHRSAKHRVKKHHKYHKNHHQKHRRRSEDDDTDEENHADNEDADDSSSARKMSSDQDDEEDEDDHKGKDQDDGKDTDQDDSDDKQVDDDGTDSEEAN